MYTLKYVVIFLKHSHHISAMAATSFKFFPPTCYGYRDPNPRHIVDMLDGTGVYLSVLHISRFAGNVSSLDEFSSSRFAGGVILPSTGPFRILSINARFPCP